VTRVLFARLADALTDDVDLIEFLHLLVEGCLEFPDVAAAGLSFTAPRGRPATVAASSDRAEILDLLTMTDAIGPGRDCYREGVAVPGNDLGPITRGSTRHGW